jgi:hypothetical protein
MIHSLLTENAIFKGGECGSFKLPIFLYIDGVFFVRENNTKELPERKKWVKTLTRLMPKNQ